MGTRDAYRQQARMTRSSVRRRHRRVTRRTRGADHPPTERRSRCNSNCYSDRANHRGDRRKPKPCHHASPICCCTVGGHGHLARQSTFWSAPLTVSWFTLTGESRQAIRSSTLPQQAVTPTRSPLSASRVKNMSIGEKQEFAIRVDHRQADARDDPCTRCDERSKDRMPRHATQLRDGHEHGLPDQYAENLDSGPCASLPPTSILTLPL
jgi:hypothetical protein